MTKIHEMNKTNQETAPAGTSPAIHACNTRISTKTGVYHAEAAAHKATLIPFVVGSTRLTHPTSEEDTTPQRPTRPSSGPTDRRTREEAR